MTSLDKGNLSARIGPKPGNSQPCYLSNVGTIQLLLKTKYVFVLKAYFPFMHCPLVSNRKARWSIGKICNLFGNFFFVNGQILNKYNGIWSQRGI